MKTLILSLWLTALSCYAYTQTYTIGSPTHSTTFPGLSSINSLFEDSRVQYIYSAEELQSVGMPTDFLIESIHLLIFDLPGVTLNNFTISMKNTGTNSFNATPTYDDGLTTVYTALSIAPGDFTTDEWKQFDLQSPFVWDGTSNLLVQICYDNPDNSAYSNDGGIYIFRDENNLNRSAYRYADLSSGCTHTGGNRSQYKAVIRLEKFCTAPNATFTINHNPSICSGTESFTLSGSEVGVNYKLYDWSDTQIGATIPGTGSLIDLPAISNTDIYYVNAEGTGSICAGPYTMKDGEDFHFISMTNYSGATNVDAGTEVTICEESSQQLNGTADIPSIILYEENFESTFKFNVRNEGDNSGSNNYETWYWSSGVYDNGSSYARVNSDSYGTFDMDESLITPEFDGSKMSSISLQFDHNLPIFSTEIADIDVWNGSSWVTVVTYTTEQGDNSTPLPANETVDLSAYKNNRMKVRFRYYNANYEYWWIIDNIVITGTPIANYSWDNESSLSNSNISNPIASPTANTTYAMTVEANGCESTDQVLIQLENKPTITSLPLTGAESCGIITYEISTDAADSEGTWNNTGIGNFEASNQAATTFTSNTFNEDITLTWSQELGVCSGSSAEIVVRFNQPIESYQNLDVNSWIWGGLTDSEWSTSDNWYKWDGFKWLKQISTVPDVTSNLYIKSHLTGDVCVSGSNLSTANNQTINNLNISSDGIMNVTNNLSVKGDISNSGTISGGSIILNGDSDQSIDGSISTVDNLTMDKTSGNVLLNTPWTVNGTLKMLGGNIVNGTNVLTVGSSSSNDGVIEYMEGFITGALKRFFPNASSSKFFPIGNGTVIRDFTVDFSSSPGLNQFITASYKTGIPQDEGENLYNGLPLITSDNKLIQNYAEEGYWEINPTNNDYESTINNTPYEISIHMNNISNALLFTSESEFENVRIIKSAGSNDPNLHHNSWTSLNHVNSTGSNADFYITGETQGFSIFNGGKNNGEALPVELVSFNGFCNGSDIEINWQTASEYNSSHFDLEYSRDGLYWSVLGTIESSVMSTELKDYFFIHENAPLDMNYYRLLQVDIDGTQKQYHPIAISCSENNSENLSIYPNPNTGSFQVIVKNNINVGPAKLIMNSSTGANIFHQDIEIGNGLNSFMISREMKAGVYYLQLIDKNSNKQMIKVIVK